MDEEWLFPREIRFVVKRRIERRREEEEVTGGTL